MNEEQAIAPKGQNRFIIIGGAFLLILILIAILAYAITPVRQAFISWWDEREEAQDLRELQELKNEEPQGELTDGQKLRLLAE